MGPSRNQRQRVITPEYDDCDQPDPFIGNSEAISRDGHQTTDFYSATAVCPHICLIYSNYKSAQQLQPRGSPGPQTPLPLQDCPQPEDISEDEVEPEGPESVVEVIRIQQKYTEFDRIDGDGGISSSCCCRRREPCDPNELTDCNHEP